jgi:hypothetical protein
MEARARNAMVRALFFAIQEFHPRRIASAVIAMQD